MSVGKRVRVTMHENASGTAVFDSAVFDDWSHDVGATTGAAVVFKDDFTGSLNDAFVVQWSVVVGDVATWTAKSCDTLLADAVAAVNAAFPSGGGVSPNN